jgi:hypothetical protein
MLSGGYYTCQSLIGFGYDCSFADECGLCPEACDDPEAVNYGAVGDCVYTCAELGNGSVDDCADNDCCPEGWIGDGIGDCEDQAYGCDLTCYDDDGGDCGPSCGEQGLILCADGSCAASEGDCPLVAGCGPTGECPEGTYFDGWSCYDCSYCLDISDDSACESPEDCCGMCGGSFDGDCDGSLSSNNDGNISVEGDFLDYSIAENLKYLSYLNSINIDNDILGGSYSVDIPNNINPNWFTESREMRIDVTDFVSFHAMSYSDKPFQYPVANRQVRDLIGYNVYRDGSFLASTTEIWYDDTDVEPGIEYCYTVTAVYDEGESSALQVCDLALDPGDIVNIGVSNGSIDIGETTSIDITMSNENEVAGFQFNIGFSPNIADIISVSTTDRTAGFSLSETNGIIVGFSMTGATVAAGDGAIVSLTIQGTALGQADVCLSNSILSDISGDEIDLFSECGVLAVGGEMVVGCMDMEALNYNPDANVACDNCCQYPADVTLSFGDVSSTSSEILMDNVVAVAGFQFTVEGATISSASGGLAESNDFMVSASGSTVIGFSLTGGTISVGSGILLVLSHDGLDGGELCLSDPILSDASSGQLSVNVGECSGETGPPSGCTDMSACNYDADAEVDDGSCEFESDCSGECGGSAMEDCAGECGGSADEDACGECGGTETDPENCIFSVVQTIDLNALMMNSISFNVVPDDTEVSSVLMDIDLLIASNDVGQYFAPNFGVDLIGEMDLAKGYDIFLQGMDDQTLTVEGLPMEPDYSMTINALQMNSVCFVPQECMDIEMIFSGLEDNILIVSDDSGAYYVPGFGVNTMGEMCPGKGYKIFLQGMDDIDFQYPTSDGLARVETAESKFWSDYAVNSISTEYDIVKTGISHPIILTELNGMVELGDELVAYADGEVVGATKIVDLDSPVVLSTWGSFTEYGADLPGYENGDAIELRLWSAEEGRELRLEANLDGTEYGTSPLTVGTAMVYGQDAVPTEFGLSQNYPNPFNPSTAIEFSIATEGFVSLNVYDITGRMVSTLVEGNLSTGYHNVIWNGIDNNGMAMSAGIYIYALQTETSSITRKMVFMK